MKKLSQKRLLLKLSSVISAMALIFTMFSCAALNAGAEATSVWDGTTASAYAGGTGTETDPFLISNGAQLYKMAAENNTYALSNGKYFKLTGDIYLNDVANADISGISSPKSWISNGTSAYIFAGKLDGGGHTVYGLYVNAQGARAGLFPQISGNAEISNLTISKSYIKTSAGRSGAIAGAVWTQAQAKISKCYIESSVTVIGRDSAGGMIGYLHNGGATLILENCASLANISGTQAGTALGGLLGGTASSNCYLQLSGCWATGAALFKNQGVTVNSQVACYAVQAEQITGSGAQIAMPLLDWTNIWKTTDSYPVFRTENDEGPGSYVNKYWDGKAAAAYAGGTGTETDPYLISNAAQLYKMVTENNSQDAAQVYYFELTQDIYVNDINDANWLSDPTVWLAGTNTYCFNDNFNGNGYVIYGLYCKADGARAGLFPQVSDGAVIKNLTISSSLVKGASGRSGALAGAVTKYGNGAEVKISDCAVVDTSVQGKDSAGGIIGLFLNNSCSVTDCYFNGTVSTANNTSGGIAADGWGATAKISNCYSVGVYPVSGTNNTVKNVKNVNVYTNVAAAPNSGKAVNGITSLEASKMKGETAKANMRGFNYNTVWKINNDSYPTLFAPSETANYWDGTAAESYAGGTGTKADPYLITNAAELFKLANSGCEETAGRYFELANDVDLIRYHDGWETDNANQWNNKEVFFNSYNNAFCGSFNGNGHTVRGIYNNLVTTANRAVGLFQTVGANAVIKNLKIDGVYITLNGKNAFTNYAGAVAGYASAAGADLSNAVAWPQIVGCTVTNANITSTYSGGIVGGNCGGLKVEACAYNGVVAAENEAGVIGGIIGDNAGACEIANSYTSVNTLAGKTDELSTFANGAADTSALDENIWDISGETPALKEIDFAAFNAETIDSGTLVAIKNKLLGKTTDYIVSINAKAGVNILDLVAAKVVLAGSADYKLTWSEEFNGNNLDSNVWNKAQNMGTEGDLKLDWNNASVNDGNLALLTTYDAAAEKYAVAGNLNTKGNMSFKHGKLEIRAKVPFGAGSFPSFWLSSKDALGGDESPAYTAEIDIFEIMAQDGNADKVSANAHKHYTADGTDYQYTWYTDGAYQIQVANPDDYHIFTFEWTAQRMTAAIDGVVYIEIDLTGNFDAEGKTTDMSQFNAPMHIMINNHMFTPDNTQEKYRYTGTDEIVTPMEYDIDYIRLYQKSGSELYLN